MKKIISSILGSLILSGGIVSCTDMLEEYNPGGGTMDQYAETDNYIAFVNQCYFAMTRYLRYCRWHIIMGKATSPVSRIYGSL